MNERSQVPPEGEGPEDVSAAEAAAYIADLCREMADMARRVGLTRTAVSLDLVRRLAADDLLDSGADV